MKLLLEILIRPRSAAEMIKQRPQWVWQFVILALVSVSLAILLHPHVVNMTLDRLPASATVQDRMEVGRMMNQDLATKSAFLPMRMLIGWSAFALMLLFACKTWRTFEPVRWYQVFSLEIAAETTLVLGQVAALVYASLNQALAFVRIPFGVDQIMPPSADTLVLMALNSVNVFSLWYIVMLAIGVRTLYGISMMKSLITVVAVWSISQIVNVSILWFLRDAFHFQL
ncbi:MAG TPA: YIP1 family protein [Bacteroidota bacterium]|nr:YIP1 family protein [Bacteroidota bacterium]